MIERIAVDIVTGFARGAGTAGLVFLGLGGREFRLDIAEHDDFEEGDEVTYEFGADSNVRHPDRNDPRTGCPITFEDVDAFPVYIRLEPRAADDDWHVVSVRVRAAGHDGETRRWSALDGSSDALWLGRQSGAILHLRRG